MLETQAELLRPLLPDGATMDAPAIAARVHRDVVPVVARNRVLLEALRSRFRLGVISNFTGNLDRCLVELGIRDVFELVTDSAIVGFTKPDPRAFVRSLEALGVSPEDSWMVGDNFEADIRPAERLGMRTVWLAPADRAVPPGCTPTARITSLTALADVVGPTAHVPRDPAAANAPARAPMHGLILAGGEGTRLAADGIGGPKATVAVAGRPQLVRLVETLGALGCETITCMLRDAMTVDIPSLDGATAVGGGARPTVRVVPCHTPSSLHTLVDGLAAVPRGNVFCTMVDTVMRSRDWRAVFDGATRALADGADAVLAVTPYVDDERPLWVHRDASGVAQSVGETPSIPPCVTGGVYAFGPRARTEAARARRQGASRMRGFLAQMVADGYRVATVEVPRIVDVDRRHDLDIANAWLGTENE